MIITLLEVDPRKFLTVLFTQINTHSFITSSTLRLTMRGYCEVLYPNQLANSILSGNINWVCFNERVVHY